MIISISISIQATEKYSTVMYYLLPVFVIFIGIGTIIGIGIGIGISIGINIGISIFIGIDIDIGTVMLILIGSAPTTLSEPIQVFSSWQLSIQLQLQRSLFASVR